MIAKKTIHNTELFNKAGKLKNPKKTFPMILEAAEESDLFGQAMLGFCYIRGLGVPRNPKKAVQWLSTAARRGDVESMYNLALIFEVGDGIPKNDRQALKWYLQAARKGDSKAQTNLALMYLQGIGVRQDKVSHGFAKPPGKAIQTLCTISPRHTRAGQVERRIGWRH
jgi:TPR repeat protein